MNIKEYISSGIVESYVLGLTNQKESAEFEQYCIQYEEVLTARTAFELQLEKHAIAHAITPPADTKERILKAIDTTTSINQSLINQSKVISMENNVSTPTRKNGSSRFLAAASIILLAGCALFAYNIYSENKTLKDSNKELKDKLTESDGNLKKILDEQKMVSNPDVTVVNLVGTQAAPKSSANIYWDSTSSDVYLVVKNMPKLPNDQQYQLWALINGKPKDLGVFDINDEKVILKMSNTEKAEAFAITIEPKGGKPSPTLEKLQSMGKTKQSL